MAAVLLLIGSGLEEATVIDELFLFSLNLLVELRWMGKKSGGSSWWYRSCSGSRGHRLSHDILETKSGDLSNDLVARFSSILLYFYLY